MYSFDHFPEDTRDGDVAQREDERSDVGDSEQIYDRMRQSQPEEAHCPKRGHCVRLSGQLRDDHERGKRREGFDRIEVGAVGTLSPEWYGPESRIQVVSPCEKPIGLDLRHDVRYP
jgi:hypothetical protein